MTDKEIGAVLANVTRWKMPIDPDQIAHELNTILDYMISNPNKQDWWDFWHVLGYVAQKGFPDVAAIYFKPMINLHRIVGPVCYPTQPIHYFKDYMKHVFNQGRLSV